MHRALLAVPTAVPLSRLPRRALLPLRLLMRLLRRYLLPPRRALLPLRMLMRLLRRHILPQSKSLWREGIGEGRKLLPLRPAATRPLMPRPATYQQRTEALQYLHCK